MLNSWIVDQSVGMNFPGSGFHIFELTLQIIDWASGSRRFDPVNLD